MLMAKEGRTLGWGVKRRLEFREFRMFWEGYVNGNDLIEAFGISVNQMYTDLIRYLGLSPHNTYYDLCRLGLDSTPAARRPQDQQIILQNPEAVLRDGHTSHVLQELS
jgi:hypothetical protein